MVESHVVSVLVNEWAEIASMIIRTKQPLGQIPAHLVYATIRTQKHSKTLKQESISYHAPLELFPHGLTTIDSVLCCFSVL
jgi:hypothetical protein